MQHRQGRLLAAAMLFVAACRPDTKLVGGPDVDSIEFHVR